MPGLMTLMPNTVQAGGAAANTQVVPQMVVFGGAGGRTNEGRVDIDGLSVGSAFNGAGVSAYIADVGNAQEVALISSGGLGETEVGGPSLNVVPKEGGTLMRGSFYSSGVTERMVDSNYTEELQNCGLTYLGSISEDLGFQRWHRRPHREGSAVVLRHVPGRRQSSDDPGGVRERECRGSDEVVVRSRPVPSGGRRRRLSQHGAASDLADHSAPQGYVPSGTSRSRARELPLAVLGDDLKACRHSGANEIIRGVGGSDTDGQRHNAPETAGYRDLRPARAAGAGGRHRCRIGCCSKGASDNIGAGGAARRCPARTRRI